MLTNKFKFTNAKIVKDDFIDLDIAIEEQEELLYEDMFQAEYLKGELILDIGWLRNEESKGYFLIILTKPDDWDNPIIRIRTDRIEQFKIGLRGVLSFIDSIL